MSNNQLPSIDKIPVRLTLESLSAETCLNVSARHRFSTENGHPMQHPLMHQIDTNPDCVSLAVCVENRPLAHAFFITG